MYWQMALKQEVYRERLCRNKKLGHLEARAAVEVVECTIPRSSVYLTITSLRVCE